MKSYTDLEQSKKLAEILPLESADYCWGLDIETLHYNNSPYPCAWKEYTCKEYYLPCWSFAALLGVLPNEISTSDRFIDKFQIDIRKYNGGNDTTFYQIAYGNNRGLSGSWHDMINTGEKDNPIDACYEMILKLHELNLL